MPQAILQFGRPMGAVGALPVPPDEFRAALSRLTTAVSVIATDGPAGVAGLTCSAVCAVSDDPAMVLACVHGKSAANAIIKTNGVLCVNCLQSGQRSLSQAFAGIGAVAYARLGGAHELQAAAIGDAGVGLSVDGEVRLTVEPCAVGRLRHVRIEQPILEFDEPAETGVDIGGARGPGRKDDQTAGKTGRYSDERDHG